MILLREHTFFFSTEIILSSNYITETIGNKKNEATQRYMYLNHISFFHGKGVYMVYILNRPLFSAI